jgi:ribonuclease PH
MPRNILLVTTIDIHCTVVQYDGYTRADRSTSAPGSAVALGDPILLNEPRAKGEEQSETFHNYIVGPMY